MPETTPQGLTRLAFGGDYNPEQWPESVWPEDVRLMREAGVTMVSVGIFSWALLEPAPGVYDFGWLDRVLDLLHENGIRADLGTPTVAPPAWFYRAHPDALPVTADGRALRVRLTRRHLPQQHPLPRRRREHHHPARRAVRRPSRARACGTSTTSTACPSRPATASPAPRTSAAGSRRRYGTVDAVNEAWGTAFWGQRYARLRPDQPAACHPDRRQPGPGAGLQAVRRRHPARELRGRAGHPAPPRTRHPGHHQLHDRPQPVRLHRLLGLGPRGRHRHQRPLPDHRRPPHPRRTSRCPPTSPARSAGGAPWLLLEHSTSGVNWQPRNPAKAPGQMARNSLAHVARGSDGAMFFQWRQSRRGAEKFHSAMLPHGGTGLPGVARGRRTRRVRRLVGAAAGHPHRRRRRRALGLAVLVGAEPPVAPQRGPRPARARRRLLRGALRPPPHGRLRPPGSRLVGAIPLSSCPRCT